MMGRPTPSSAARSANRPGPFTPTIDWPTIAVMIDEPRMINEAGPPIHLLRALIKHEIIRSWKETKADIPQPGEFTWQRHVPVPGDYGGVQYCPAPGRVVQRSIRFAEHNAQATVTRAAAAGFHGRDIKEQALAYGVSRVLPAHMFITARPERLVAGKESPSMAVSVKQALAVIGLQQRVRNTLTLPSSSSRSPIQYDTGWAQRIAAVHLTPAVWKVVARAPRGREHPILVNQDGENWPDWLRAITDRFEEALECRDAIRLRDIGAPGGSWRTHSTLLTQLTVALDGALDLLARAVNAATGPPFENRSRCSWSDGNFRGAIDKRTKTTAEVWRRNGSHVPLIKLVNRLRNSIHANPIPSIAAHVSDHARPLQQLVVWPDDRQDIQEGVAALHRPHWIELSNAYLILRPVEIADELPELVAQVVSDIIVSIDWPVTDEQVPTGSSTEPWDSETGAQIALLYGFGYPWQPPQSRRP